MQQHHNAHLREVAEPAPSSALDAVRDTHTYFMMNKWFEGEPDVTVGADGMINIRLVRFDGPYISLSVTRWRQLSALVEAAITEAGAA